MSLAELSKPQIDAGLVPLCVDLDGTLVKSDTLVDSLLVLCRQHPARLLQLPGALLRGKAGFKRFVTSNCHLDVAHLPYNTALLSYLRAQRQQGRRIYLATGADRALAVRVAEHLGLFDDVLGSDGQTNLIGANKLERLKQQFGRFSYIGNARADLKLLASSVEPLVANPTLGLRIGMKSAGIQPVEYFRDQVPPLKCLLKTVRLHQWAKNVLIFVPLLLAHKLALAGILSTLLAFLCFGLAASATYILNDLLDIEADRRHPRKRRRPFAAGELSPFIGVGISVTFLATALVVAQILAPAFLGWLLLYLVSTVSYSFYLKRVPLVDVLVLAGLYTLRLQAGGAVSDTQISHWLAGFSIFLFLSLAFVKRFAELENLRSSGSAPKNGRGYLVADMEQLRSFGTSSAFAAVVVFANYISGREVTALYRHPSMLWLSVPLMVLWLCRVWLLASRGELDEDPVVFALTDRMSLLMGVVVAALVVCAL